MKLAVIFDLNGVIVDDEALHELAFREVLTARKLVLEHEDYIKYFAGRTDRDGFALFLSQIRPELIGEIALMVPEKSDAYKMLANENLSLYDDAIRLVRRLQLAGHSLALVTGALRDEVSVILEKAGLGNVFECIVTAEDVSEGKPSPEPFLLAAKKLNILPSHCVVIEDSPSGVTSARAAGMRCIAVTSTHSGSELRRASEVVSNLDELTSGSLSDVVGA